jgi:hypothetical protein
MKSNVEIIPKKFNSFRNLRSTRLYIPKISNFPSFIYEIDGLENLWIENYLDYSVISFRV